jgi:hypothetical protein
MKYFLQISTFAMSIVLATSAAAENETKESANATLFGAETAFILPHGFGYIGATLTDPRVGIAGSGRDGDLSFGAGFGNPVSAVGVQVDVNITGIFNGFADSGSLTLKTARALVLQPNQAVFGAVSISNVAAWGDAAVSDAQWNMTISGLTQIEGPTLIHPIIWTVGYGSDAVLQATGSSLTTAGFFGGVGVGLTKNTGISVSATQNQLNAGIGLKVPGLNGVSISYGVIDITDNMERKQHSLSVSYTLQNIFGG